MFSKADRASEEGNAWMASRALLPWKRHRSTDELTPFSDLTAAKSCRGRKARVSSSRWLSAQTSKGPGEAAHAKKGCWKVTTTPNARRRCAGYHRGRPRHLQLHFRALCKDEKCAGSGLASTPGVRARRGFCFFGLSRPSKDTALYTANKPTAPRPAA